MRLFVAPYFMTPKTAPNARTKAQRVEGRLLKVEFVDGVGYSSFQTWPSLGDPEVWQVEQTLSRGPQTSIQDFFDYLTQSPEPGAAILARAFEFALVDYEARKAKVHLLDWFPRVKTNFTVAGMDPIPHIPAGVICLKIKVGKDFSSQIPWLEDLSHKGYQLRLDFNGVLTASEYLRFEASCSQGLKKSIQYVEDPLGDLVEILTLQAELDLALDRLSVEDYQRLLAEPDLLGRSKVRTMVLKPAIIDIAQVVGDFQSTPLQFVITNYMDHPVANVFAYYEACRWAHKYPDKLLMSGCRTEHLFETNPDFISLYENNELVRSEGLGVGYDQELEGQKWIKK